MLKKLRRKFILTNMLLVSMVLLMVFGGLLGSTSQRLRGQSLDALRLALRWTEESPKYHIDFEPDSTGRGQHRADQQVTMVPAFCVELDEEGGIASYSLGGNLQISEEALEQAVEQVMDAGQTDGTISRPVRLRYLTETDEDGTLRIAFADRSWEAASMKDLVLSSLLVGAAALVCFYLVSLLLSTVALRPVERAWEQQRQFVADASHELKTPLTVILANAGIVLAHPEDTVARQEKWLTFIQEEAGRMKGLVEDLLFLAKNDAARGAKVCAELSMSDLTMGCLLPFESVAFESGVALEGDIPPDLTIQGDEGQLRRLVMILLDNAVKYAGESGRVDLTLRRQQDKLRLTVHNTGDPIPPEHLPHLFERFYRSDSARSRDKGGFGLGLAIARTIVEDHGGRLTVTSSAEDGTRFTAILPVRQKKRRWEKRRKLG
ncbi:cell wall metabolism sensor histidine kinase WalK [Pseudoflavonifractor sp. MSJ-37]|uniref:sensor histidine kinase n=1 Tax=Pseudoflavonifractor sp. MSJ-37 TaxID=2841531 RepID=UPI001C0F96FE|nr:HAMP domain-containing sensor histidine kinase [Pseudoflavonifractor sp. MSJ-37]MBU5434043.1 HAMP domain-containing histidine kinase [Pseudoflavonifractor sp. MSJ-37]